MFFYPDKFVFAHFWGISTEWMKKLFLFPGLYFFFGLKNLMNEWQLNFSEKKNNTQKHTKIQEKKHNPHLLKKWEFLKIRMNG